MEKKREDARVAQWWSIALPRRGSRVRIPSRALRKDRKSLKKRGSPVFHVIYRKRADSYGETEINDKETMDLDIGSNLIYRIYISQFPDTGR